MAACLVYVTCGDKEEASSIAGAIVTDRLAACANLIPGMTSVYRWQGAIQQDEETVLILKTRDELVPALTERIKALHSYDCPCVVALPISAGNPGFLDWIAAETGNETG